MFARCMGGAHGSLNISLLVGLTVKCIVGGYIWGNRGSRSDGCVIGLCGLGWDRGDIFSDPLYNYSNNMFSCLNFVHSSVAVWVIQIESIGLQSQTRKKGYGLCLPLGSGWRLVRIFFLLTCFCGSHLREKRLAFLLDCEWWAPLANLRFAIVREGIEGEFY